MSLQIDQFRLCIQKCFKELSPIYIYIFILLILYCSFQYFYLLKFIYGSRSLIIIFMTCLIYKGNIMYFGFVPSTPLSFYPSVPFQAKILVVEVNHEVVVKSFSNLVNMMRTFKLVCQIRVLSLISHNEHRSASKLWCPIDTISCFYQKTVKNSTVNFKL